MKMKLVSQRFSINVIARQQPRHCRSNLQPRLLQLRFECRFAMTKRLKLNATLGENALKFEGMLDFAHFGDKIGKLN